MLTELVLPLLLLLSSSIYASFPFLPYKAQLMKNHILPPTPFFSPSSFQFWGEFLPSGFAKIFMWKGKISCLSVIHFVIEILEVAMVRVINISIINLFHKLLKLSSASVKQTKS